MYWYGYDVQMKHLIDSDIPAEMAEVVAFASFATEPPEHHEICNRHRVLNLPFLAFYRDGSLLHSVTGSRPVEVINQYLKELVRGPDQKTH